MIEVLRRSGICFQGLYAIALCLSLNTAVCALGAALALAPATAHADDDDDGDDDNGGGGGGGGRSGGGFSGSGGGFSSDGGYQRRGSDGGNIFDLFRKRQTRTPTRARRAAPRRSQPRRATRSRPARTAPRPAAVPLPTRANAEIVALGLTSEQLDQLLAQGYAVLQQEEIVAVGATLIRLSVPAGTSLEDARAAVRAIDAGAVADFNHFYRPVEIESEAGERCEGLSCGAALQIAWPVHPGTLGRCAAGATIGMIDTGINTEHEAIAHADLTVLAFDTGRTNERDSSASHGTAVAAILLSSDRSRAPGLMPDAKVYAVDAFFRAVAAGNVPDERTDAFTLVRAMDVLAERPITVLNLSLAGPANTTVERMIETLVENAVVVVASAGNAGPQADPLYPAGYASVIGVTAVDHTNRVFRRATQGDHVDLAAPGVEVWAAASVRGVKPRTGTSFATPFVTAVVALLQSREGLPELEDIRDALASGARDLGKAGRDPVYGFGLVQAPGPCIGEGEPPVGNAEATRASIPQEARARPAAADKEVIVGPE